MDIFDIFNEREKIIENIEDNKKHPDSEGFVFLTNQEKGKPLPFDFAQDCGYTQPVFKIKGAYDIYKNNVDSMEGVWVKEGIENDVQHETTKTK